MNVSTAIQRDLLGACMERIGIPLRLHNSVDEDMSDNLQAYVSSSAGSTLDCFRTDIIRWFAWCDATGASPLKPAARNVRDFIREFEHGRKPATIRRMIVNIGVLISAIAGNPNVTHTKIVRAEMKRIRREKGSAHKQALAIRQLGFVGSMDDVPQPFSIKRMIQALDGDHSLRVIRGKFILSLGGDTGRRHSEYYRAQIRHLFDATDGEGTFHVERSKTDQEGKGLTRWVSKRTMRFFREWIVGREASGEIVTSNSWLPISVDRWGTPLPQAHLSSQGYQIALRSAVRTALTRMVPDYPELQAQIDGTIEKISGHSFRVGKVEDFVTAGEPITAICIEGGWETPTMPIMYGRNLSVKNGAAARLQRRLGDE